MVLVCPVCEAEAVLGEDGELHPRLAVGLDPIMDGSGLVTGNEMPCFDPMCDAVTEFDICVESPRSRVGQLRGAGNAILGQLGAVFVRAGMDVIL